MADTPAPPDHNADPPEDFARQRINICRSCEHYSMFICGKCGCFMPAKTRFKGTACPIGRWHPVQ